MSHVSASGHLTAVFGHLLLASKHAGSERSKAGSICEMRRGVVVSAATTRSPCHGLSKPGGRLQERLHEAGEPRIVESEVCFSRKSQPASSDIHVNCILL